MVRVRLAPSFVSVREIHEAMGHTGVHDKGPRLGLGSELVVVPQELTEVVVGLFVITGVVGGLCCSPEETGCAALRRSKDPTNRKQARNRR